MPSCETEGHVFGSRGICVMCKTPKEQRYDCNGQPFYPNDEQPPSKEWMDRWSALQLANESTQSIAASAFVCELAAENERLKRPAHNPLEKAACSFAGKVKDSYILKLWFESQEDLDAAFDLIDEAGAMVPNDSSAADPAKSLSSKLGELLISRGYFDRMKDLTPEDTAERVVSEFLALAKPIVSQHYGRTPEPCAIQWSAVQTPNSDCGYTHLIGDTPFGRILITWKGWKETHDLMLDESPWGLVAYVGSTVEDAKKTVEAEFNKRLALCRASQPPGVDVRAVDCPACGKPMSEHKGELKPGAVLWCP